MITALQQHQSHRIHSDSTTQSNKIMGSEIYVLPAVRALGPLFKLTEVHLWDNGDRDSRYFQERNKRYSGRYDHKDCEKWGHDGYEEYEKRKYARNGWCCSSPEDVKPGKKMNDWGLPLASDTKKEKRYEMNSWRKDTRMYNQQSPTESTSPTSCITTLSSASDHSSDSEEVDSAPCKNEMIPNALSLIRRTTERKCSISPQPRFYVATNSRNDNTCSSNSNQKVRRTKSGDDGVLREETPSISKYWSQRYQLFSRFDYGIKMDEEGWFSVTPEAIAKHQATRCGNGIIVDLFAGVGGNSIQFAQRSKRVIAIDIDPNKIDYARHNAFIYEVDDKINFINADCFSLVPKLKADTVFMSPPWGGPNYTKVKRFDIHTMLEPRDGQSLFNAGKEIAPHIVMFLPRNVDINQLAELALSATPWCSLEVEKNFLNGRLKAITAYFVKTSNT